MRNHCVSVVRRMVISQCGFVLSFVLLTAGCKDFGHDPPPESKTVVPPGTVVSFKIDVKKGIFDKPTYGCTPCHGGNGNLIIENVAGLLRGGLHGPAIVPGNADSSIIINKLSPNPRFGDRMPQGGAPMAESDINVIRAWINQGAKDN